MYTLRKKTLIQLEAKLFKLAAKRLETYFTSLTLPVLRNNGYVKLNKFHLLSLEGLDADVTLRLDLQDK